MKIDHENRGNVHTLGEKSFGATITAYAFEVDKCLYFLSMHGSGTAIDAIKANATMGQPLELKLKTQHYPVRVSTKGIKFLFFKKRLQRVQQTHCIMIASDVVNPQYGDEKLYVVGSLYESREKLVMETVRRVLPVGMFPHQYEWLMYRNDVDISDNRPVRMKADGVQGYVVKNGSHWIKYLSEGLQHKAIYLV